uniref:Microtubule-associated protein futsch n=1 Tax=Haemonchus contortus TaxID=6289 RepID=A0A7I4XTW0_HAECO
YCFMEDDSDASIELGAVLDEPEDDHQVQSPSGEKDRPLDDESDASNELGDVHPNVEPQGEPSGGGSGESSREKQMPEMDEHDIAEMSMIAAQIESAENFDLTLETVDTSELQEEPIKEVRPKSRQAKKEVSPLYKSDSDSIEKFLEEGMNESMSVVEEAKVNMALADSLLNEWGGSPIKIRKRSLSEHEKQKDDSGVVLLTSTPLGPPKKFSFESTKSTASSKKRVFTSKNYQQSPLRKKRAGTAENSGERSGSKGTPESGVDSPIRSKEKSRTGSKHPLKMRNV